MRRLGLALVLALSSAGVAAAQSNMTTGNAQINDNPNSSVVQPGIAKPPAGMSPPAPTGKQQVGVPPNMANNPTSSQLALHPSATVGSPVPIAGPGGTTSTATGNNHQEFAITRLFRRLFAMF